MVGESRLALGIVTKNLFSARLEPPSWMVNSLVFRFGDKKQAKTVNMTAAEYHTPNAKAAQKRNR